MLQVLSSYSHEHAKSLAASTLQLLTHLQVLQLLGQLLL